MRINHIVDCTITKDLSGMCNKVNVYVCTEIMISTYVVILNNTIDIRCDILHGNNEYLFRIVV